MPVRTDGLRAPVIVAPMCPVSGPGLVVASCRAGLVGSFPLRNARTPWELASGMDEIHAGLAGLVHARWAASMIVQRDYARFEDELALVLRYRPPIVLTALGSPRRVVAAVRDYGGAVFAEVISVEQALKAAFAGADGLVLVRGGSEDPSPLAMIDEVRTFFSGPLAVGGGFVTGRDVRAAEVLGADLAYVGGRFGACAEAAVDSPVSGSVDSSVDGLVDGSAGVPGGIVRAADPDLASALTGLPLGWVAEGWPADGADRAPADEVAGQVVAEYHAAVAAESGV
ncbi:nitronate monooxygenase [Pseudonocardia eucalypti]|uniref:Nitronate monooxygenase n=2 Tax=Pseudonocardia eucalypti TaxID=648755 RepID=A0ABP9RB50_9PSEU